MAVIFQLQSLCQFGGISAGHIDWTMVPYVRKSFWKHMKDACKYIDKIEAKPINAKGELINFENVNWNTDFDISRDRFGCSDEAYKYAMDMTEREIH